MTRPSRLYLFRHAKSDWHSAVDRDFDRPLNARGRRSAPHMGVWLGDHGIRPNGVYASPAVRARETLLLAAPGLGLDPARIHWRPEIYAAPAERLLALLAAIPAQAWPLMLVGHNPGLEDLLQWLVGPAALADQGPKLLPTAACAELEVTRPGAQSLPGQARLIGVYRPRQVLDRSD